MLTDSAIRASIVPSSYDEATNQIDVSLGVGADVRRLDWRTDKPYIERLDLSDGAVRLERMNARAPLLIMHNAWDLRSVVGCFLPDTVRIEGGELLGRVQLSDAAGDADTVRKIATGITPNLSMAYWTHKQEIDASGDIEIRTATDWEPYEGSVVTIGADPAAQTRNAQTNPAAEPPGERGAKPLDTPAAPPEARGNSMNEDQIRAEAQTAERKRISDIEGIARKAGIEVADPAVRQLVEGGKTLDDARVVVLDLVAAKRDATPTSGNTGVGGAQVVVTDREQRIAAIENAIEHRANPDKVPLSDGGRAYYGMRLVELGRECLRISGNAFSGVPDDVARRALSAPPLSLAERSMSGAAGTSDFPLILANVAGKRLRRGYTEIAQTWRPLVLETNAADFKLKFPTVMSEGPDLEKVNEAGEFKRGTFTEGRESYKIATYGKIIAITRQTIVNDDLGAFTRVPGLLGAAANRLESDLFWALFLGAAGLGATLSDGKTVIHADHKNVVSGAGKVGAPSFTTLAATRLLMRKQTGLAGKRISVTPAFLVCSEELAPQTRRLFAPGYAPTTAADVMPEDMRVPVICDPRVDDVNANAWYLVANPGEIDTIELAYLEGQRGIYMETRYGFEVDGMEMKARHDVGMGTIEHRGFVRNPGA